MFERCECQISTNCFSLFSGIGETENEKMGLKMERNIFTQLQVMIEMSIIQEILFSILLHNHSFEGGWMTVRLVDLIEKIGNLKILGVLMSNLNFSPRTYGKNG